MPLDVDFHELATRHPEVALALAGVDVRGPYRADALEVKRSRRVDCVFTPLDVGPEGGPRDPRVFLELQARHDPDAERRLLEEVVLACAQDGWFEPVEVCILYTERRFLETAKPADVGRGRRMALRFTPQRLVLAEIASQALLARGGPALIALPLTGPAEGVLREAASWHERLLASPELAGPRRTDAVELFCRLLADRLGTTEIQGLLREGDRVMEDTATGQRLIERGIERGALRARRQDVLRALELRLGPVPAALAARIEGIESPDALDALFERAILSASYEDFARAMS